MQKATKIVRDPSWQFIAVVVACLGLILAYYFFSQQQVVKKMSADISLTGLVSIDDAVKGRIKVLVDDRQAENVGLLVVKIQNTGNVPIKREDFDTPLTVILDDNAEVISGDFIGASDSGLQSSVSPKIDKGKITFPPALFNSQDYVTYKALVLNAKSAGLTVRIVGVSQIERIPSPVSQGLSAIFAVELIILAIVGVILVRSVMSLMRSMAENKQATQKLQETIKLIREKREGGQDTL
jgi:archaellum component FlaG (FlaF/FlaG flagellin family)